MECIPLHAHLWIPESTDRCVQPYASKKGHEKDLGSKKQHPKKIEVINHSSTINNSSKSRPHATCYFVAIQPRESAHPYYFLRRQKQSIRIRQQSHCIELEIPWIQRTCTFAFPLRMVYAGWKSQHLLQNNQRPSSCFQAANSNPSRIRNRLPGSFGLSLFE